MMHIRHPKYLLWLIAATLLLMQSMAVWHDAEHAFHDHIALCDQLNVVSHTPSIETDSQFGSLVWQQYSQLNQPVTLVTRVKKTYLALAIRAPPQFS